MKIEFMLSIATVWFSPSINWPFVLGRNHWVIMRHILTNDSGLWDLACAQPQTKEAPFLCCLAQIFVFFLSKFIIRHKYYYYRFIIWTSNADSSLITLDSVCSKIVLHSPSLTNSCGSSIFCMRWSSWWLVLKRNTPVFPSNNMKYKSQSV